MQKPEDTTTGEVIHSCGYIHNEGTRCPPRERRHTGPRLSDIERAVDLAYYMDTTIIEPKFAEGAD